MSSSRLEGNLSSAGYNTDACQESKSETMLTVEEEEEEETETETDPDVSTTSGNLLCRMGRH